MMVGKNRSFFVNLFSSWGVAVLTACGSPSFESSADFGPGSEVSPHQYPGENPAGFPETFGWGREASVAEIDSLSITVFPDGTGLPPGSGTAILGKSIYTLHCAACHGATGKEGPEEVLVGTDVPQRGEKRYPKTIGNYWPYSTTVFDYIRRAMPSHAPGILTDSEVYSITAWLLYQNRLIDDDFLVDRASLPTVRMPAAQRFKIDDRSTGPNPVY